jgi:acyl transferase domain-containing protein/acyl carrier protein
VFVEVSAHPVLSMPLTDASADHDGVVVGTLARERGDRAQLLRNLSLLHVHGHHVDWPWILPEADPVGLPTYAFQPEYYWLPPAKPQGDPDSLGLDTFRHRWLGAATAVAEGDSHLLTGRLSLDTDRWLGDHTVFGTALLPGTGLLELAWAAAQEVGMSTVDDLTLEEPLLFPDTGNVRLQVTVGPPQPDGRRSVAVHSSWEDVQDGWTCHATGTLSDEPAAGSRGFAELARLLVPGSEQVDPAAFYQTFTDQGLGYGPAFRGVVELWRLPGTGYGRVRLPDGLDAADFGVHPALLDAALQMLAAARGQPAGEVLLPFEWTSARLHRTAATDLRVRADWDEDARTGRLLVADPAGRPVAEATLQARAATPEQIRASRPVEHLYLVEFQEVRAAAPAPVTTWVLGDEDTAGALRAPSFVDLDAAVAALGEQETGPPARLVVTTTATEPATAVVDTHDVLRRVLTEPRLDAAEVVVLTRHAVRVSPGEDVPNLAHAPLWGLIRVAAKEHADRRVRIVDVDDTTHLAAALAVADEPELAVRQGSVLAPRLVRATRAESTGPRLDPDGTVVITGGAGELGRVVAAHLVREHGVRHLVLTSRRGAQVDGLAAELAPAEVSVVACDVADRAQVAALLGGLARPLTAVFHLAGVLDDGLLEGQDEERLRGVLAPKVAGALHLHELTSGMELAAFVLFSSAAGVLGGVGQGGYAAANAFLDALAEHRRAVGLPAVSLSWGLWQQAGVGMTAHLGKAELDRIRRQGVSPLTPEQGLRLLDQALAQPEPHLVPARLDLGSLRRERDRGGDLPALFRVLVRGRPRQVSDVTAAPDALREQLLALPGPGRMATVTELVQREVAVVLGRTGEAGIGARQVLKELGIDSLMAVELRRRVATATGTTLPATLAFDYPTPEAIAGLVLARLDMGGADGTRAPRLTRSRLDELVDLLRSASPQQLEADGLAARLIELHDGLARTVGAAKAEPDTDSDMDIDSSSQEDLLDFLDRKFGAS